MQQYIGTRKQAMRHPLRVSDFHGDAARIAVSKLAEAFLVAAISFRDQLELRTVFDKCRQYFQDDAGIFLMDEPARKSKERSICRDSNQFGLYGALIGGFAARERVV